MSFTLPFPIQEKIPATNSPLKHRGVTFIKVDIPNTAQAKEKNCKVQGRKWNQTHRYWYISNSYKAINESKQYKHQDITYLKGRRVANIAKPVFVAVSKRRKYIYTFPINLGRNSKAR